MRRSRTAKFPSYFEHDLASRNDLVSFEKKSISANAPGWHVGNHIVIVPVRDASEHWDILGLITRLQNTKRSSL